MNYESASSVFFNFTTLSPYFPPTITQVDPSFWPMNNDRAEVDELTLKIADYKNDLGDVASEKLLRKCSPVGKRIPSRQVHAVGREYRHLLEGTSRP
jgi:hypothetical protein